MLVFVYMLYKIPLDGKIQKHTCTLATNKFHIHKFNHNLKLKNNLPNLFWYITKIYFTLCLYFLYLKEKMQN